MSTAGGAEVVAAPILIVGGVAVVAVGAVVGAGVLIGRGLVWCGKKLEENYQHACQEQTNLVERARAENMANVQEMGNYLADQLDCMSTSAYLTVNLATPQSSGAEEPKRIAEAIARTRKAITGATVVQQRGTTEQELLALQLQAEIQAGRGILPSEHIAAAEVALHGSSTAKKQALITLQADWQSVTEERALRNRHISQTQQILQKVALQLSTVETMSLDLKGGRAHFYTEQQQAIEAMIREVRRLIDIHPATALKNANEAQQAARDLVNAVSDEMMTSWNSTRKEINVLRGTLDTLAKMVQEATAIQLIDPKQSQGLTERITKAQKDAQALAQGDVATGARHITRLKERVALLKDDVFTRVKTSQQRSVAQIVATTLAELGFRSSNGEQPVLKQNGDIVRIEAITVKEASKTRRDEKMISFDVSPDGAVAYDFSGYAGDSCVHDAKRVFDALRAKGLFILDAQGSKVLQQLPTTTVSAETLREERFEPSITKNKTQAELAEALKRILVRMNYTQVQQSVIGGSIELEAFNGKVGYRVVLPPDGSVRVLKDAQRTDISSNAHDPVVGEAKRIIEQQKEVVEAEEEPSTSQRRSFTHQRKQQASG